MNVGKWLKLFVTWSFQNSNKQSISCLFLTFQMCPVITSMINHGATRDIELTTAIHALLWISLEL